MRDFEAMRVVVVAAVVTATGAVRAADMTVTVSGLPVPGLVSVKPDKPLDHKTSYVLTDGSQTLPAQLDKDGRLWWFQPKACENAESCTYKLEAQPAGDPADQGVKVSKVKDGLIDVSIDGKPFTAFNYGKDAPKPYLYPVLGPTGAPVTRHYPMEDVKEERGTSKKDTRQDHPHHRSIWTAHGDVRTGDYAKKGTDYWAVGKNCGLEKVTKIVSTTSGPVFGRIVADVDWVTAAGKKELSDTRTYTFYKTNENYRVIDYKIVFKFTEGDVMFADTKEGGIVSLRVATSMDEQTAGHMVNSAGGKGEKECWGKPADWCDYYGPVDGQTVGIMVMDAKTNWRHPQTWHIRAYGLYTANPFGLKAFGENKEGSKTWKKGETAEFNYRILIHKGDTAAVKAPEKYQVYSGEAKVTLK